MKYFIVYIVVGFLVLICGVMGYVLLRQDKEMSQWVGGGIGGPTGPCYGKARGSIYLKDSVLKANMKSLSSPFYVADEQECDGPFEISGDQIQTPDGVKITCDTSKSVKKGCTGILSHI